MASDDDGDVTPLYENACNAVDTRRRSTAGGFLRDGWKSDGADADDHTQPDRRIGDVRGRAHPLHQQRGAVSGDGDPERREHGGHDRRDVDVGRPGRSDRLAFGSDDGRRRGGGDDFRGTVWSLLCAGFLDGDPAERRGEATIELTQSEAEVGGVVDLGADRRLEVNSGEVSIDGTLRLTFDATTFAIEGAELDVEVLSWETRADTPGNMTGGFQFVYSWALSTGSAVVDVVFEEVTRTAGAGD